MAQPRYTLNPDDLRRIPSPPVPEWFTRELHSLLPPNPWGEPGLAVGWGMDIGTDGRTDGLQKPFGEWSPKYVAAKRAVRETFYAVTTTKNSMLANVQWYGTCYSDVPKVLGEGQLVIKRKYRRVELYGVPLFIIGQWKPAHMHATRESWEASRWHLSRKMEFPNSTYDRATGMYRADTLGEYPARGVYELVMHVEDPEGGYVSLDEAGDAVLSELRARLAAREQYRKSREQAIRDARYESEQVKLAEERKMYDEVFTFLNDHHTHLVEGDAHSGWRPAAPTAPSTVIKQGGSKLVLATS